MWMGFVLVGLALSRLDLSSRGTLLKMLATGAVVATLATLLAWGTGGVGHGSVGSGAGSAGSGSGGSVVVEEGSFEGMPAISDTETWPDGTVIDWTTQTATRPDGTVLEGKEFESYLNTESGTISGAGPRFDTETPLPDPGALFGLTPHSSTPMEFLAFGGTAVAIVALCLLLPLWRRRLALPLAAVGAMSLTAYSAHVVMVYLWPDFFMNHENNVPYAVMVGSLIVFALVWRFTLGRGPLEALLRSVSVRAARVE
ncbi:DUF418 domain-containing protein [Ornithinimicrobium sp. Y1847]